MSGLIQVKPEEIGLSSARLTHVSRLISRRIQSQELTGAVAIVARHGKIAHISAHGKMDIEQDKLMREEALFRLYSMTQPILAAALLILYEQGYFQLSDPVSLYIPSFKELRVSDQNKEKGASMRQVTIQDLLTHTSGLIFNPTAPSASLDSSHLTELRTTGGLATFIQTLSTSPLAFQPGHYWHRGLGYEVVGYLIELFSEMRLDEFIQKKVTAPMNMLDTGFFIPKHKQGRLVNVYTKSFNGNGSNTFSLLTHEALTDHFLTLPTYLSGGQGLLSSGPDYLRFCQMLLNKGELDGNRLLSRKTVELMTSNHLVKDIVQSEWTPSQRPLKGFGFGLGVTVMLDPAQAAVLGTPGDFSRNGQAGTSFFVDPKEELIGIFLTQLLSPTPANFQRDLRVAIYQSLLK